MSRTLKLASGATLGAVVVLMPVALWMVFAYAPEERVMGPVQRIFYFHVPLAFMTFLSVFVLLAASIGYLWTRSAAWDRVGRASTEIGLLFCTLVLVTGPIWARPAWGQWWTWEARLTTTLVLWMLLAGSLLVRSQARDPDSGARIAAVFGIVAALDVPVVYKAVDWWRGQHPILFEPGERPPLAPRMLQTFVFCLGTFLVLYVALLTLRVAVATIEDRAARLAERAEGLS